MALPFPANNTCDIYRAANSPPAAPDVAGVPCVLEPCYERGRETGEGESAIFRFTHVLHVELAVDVRDDFNEYTGTAANRDKVYIPDKTGIQFLVTFVERIARGLPSDHKQVYLDRKLPAWPIPLNAAFQGSGGLRLAGTATVAIFHPTNFSLTGSGGLRVDGAATITIHHPTNFALTGGAGLRLAGTAAITIHHPTNFSLTASGGLRTGGNATITFG